MNSPVNTTSIVTLTNVLAHAVTVLPFRPFAHITSHELSVVVVMV